MNESDAQALLDDLLAGVPDRPAPLGELGAAGERARRRARRRTTWAAGAAGAVVVGAAVLVPQAVGGGGADPAGVAESAPSAPSGTPFDGSWVGIGRVAIKVEWAKFGCVAGTPDGVLTVSEGDCGQAYTLPQGYVRIAPLDTADGRRAARGADRPDTINGVSVLGSRRDGCADNSIDFELCTATVVVPGERVVVTIAATSPSFTDGFRDSLQRLPDDVTTVPVLGDLPSTLPGVDAVIATLEASGLVVDAGARDRYVSGIDLRQGAVVRRGTTVTLSTTPYRKGAPAIPDIPPVLDGTYELELDGAPAGTVTFDGGALSGSDGCNDLFGTFVQDGSDLMFPRSDLGSTLVGCGDEPPVVQTLLRVRHVTRDRGYLYLQDGDGETLARLGRIG